jgi:predicted amidophosphoribosyltransferase
MCGFDFSDLKINNDFSDSFFKEHPEYEEYRKNLDFFNGINKFNDYDSFLFEFKEYCNEKNIDLPFFASGMIECPQCSDFFSFISPHFIINHDCPHCASEFDFDSKESYCLNCGRPVRDGQMKCECGYEFVDMKCPNCRTFNPYTYNFCTSCGKKLMSHDLKFQLKPPRGCYSGNTDRLILDIDFIKKESLKDPYRIDNKVYADVLRSEYLKHDKIISEISSRWWIVSPFNCKVCRRKIDPFEGNCAACSVTHHSDVYDNRVKELKTVKGNYAETERSPAELSNLKWTYKLEGADLNDYLNSLAPKIGESQLEYRKRLIKEYGENCAISYLIKIEWNIYFKNACMNCGSEFEKYNLACPSCGMIKEMPALSVLLNDEYVETESFPRQYDDFSDNVKSVCRDNGGDIQYADDGVVGCPQCSNYFHYLTPEFIDTQRCPHCGVYFNFDATIYQDESDLEGLPYEDYMEMTSGEKYW